MAREIEISSHSVTSSGIFSALFCGGVPDEPAHIETESEIKEESEDGHQNEGPTDDVRRAAK